MGITTSYNRHTGVRYAYDTTYETDEGTGKKVQRRRCIGHIDPETGEIVPNGRRGRPRVTDGTSMPKASKILDTTDPTETSGKTSEARLEQLAAELETIALKCDELSARARAIVLEVHEILEEA